MTEEVLLSQTPFYKSIVSDYLNKSEHLKSFITDWFSAENVERFLETKYLSFAHRTLVSDVIKAQNEGLGLSQEQANAIDLIKDSRTFTVTTGHQLNIYTGPFFFLLKIAQTIALAKTLKNKYPGYNFVPVYWMASEDHDFPEINHLHLFGKKYEWSAKEAGAVGRISTNGIPEIASDLEELFQRNPEVLEIIHEIKEAYSSSDTLSEATRRMVHAIFKNEPLVILDADEPALKKLFVGQLKNELFNQTIHEEVEKSSEELEKLGYHKQVNPREINLFYLGKNSRNRIIREGNQWKVLDSDVSWSGEELEQELENHPERFSPNALFRPVYQEFLLPNLVSILGPGELSYWLQLKSTFDALKVDFPILKMRNSHTFITEKEKKVVDDLDIGLKDMLTDWHILENKLASELAPVILEDEVGEVKEALHRIKEKVSSIDDQLKGRYFTAEKNILKELDQLTKKIEKFGKEKNERLLKKVRKSYDAIISDGGLKERKSNFLEILNKMTMSQLLEKITVEDLQHEAKLYVHVN